MQSDWGNKVEVGALLSSMQKPRSVGYTRSRDLAAGLARCAQLAIGQECATCQLALTGFVALLRCSMNREATLQEA